MLAPIETRVFSIEQILPWQFFPNPVIIFLDLYPSNRGPLSGLVCKSLIHFGLHRQNWTGGKWHMICF
jgi:hypothetical protein